jgi:hypothetical protein
VVLFARGALVGTALRPRWIEWAEIHEVVLEDDHDGFGRAGHVPVIRLNGQRRVKLGAFFAPSGARDDIAAAVVNAFNSARPLTGSQP